MAKHDFPTSEAMPSLVAYAVAYILTVVALMLVAVALATFTNTSLPSGLSTAIPVVAGGLLAAQRYAAALDAIPSTGAAWRFAFAATGITLALNGVFALFIVALVPETLALLDEFGAFIAIAVVFVMTLTLLGLRFMVRSSAKGQLKARAKRAAA